MKITKKNSNSKLKNNEQILSIKITGNEQELNKDISNTLATSHFATVSKFNSIVNMDQVNM